MISKSSMMPRSSLQLSPPIKSLDSAQFQNCTFHSSPKSQISARQRPNRKKYLKKWLQRTFLQLHANLRTTPACKLIFWLVINLRIAPTTDVRLFNLSFGRTVIVLRRIIRNPIINNFSNAVLMNEEVASTKFSQPIRSLRFLTNVTTVSLARRSQNVYNRMIRRIYCGW